MAFTVTSQITNDPNLTIIDNTLVDNTWIIIARVTNPQSNTYTFYWDFTKDKVATIETKFFYRDTQTDVEYERFVKDLTTNTLIEDYFDLTSAGKGSLTEVVMRNESHIKIVLTPDDLTGNDTFVVMVKDNPLLGSGNR